ncbi:MAG: A24 family peptidase [Pirellulaceae bacterium]
MNDPTLWVMILVVVSFTLTAATLDVRTRKVPNWLTVPVFAAGLIFHTLTGGLSGLGFAAGGFATGFGILLVLWLIGGGGGGDVKLMGALGAWLGPAATLAVFLGSTLIAISVMMVLFFATLAQSGYAQARRRYFLRRNSGVAVAAGDPAYTAQRTRQRPLAYALPVAVSTCVVLAWQVLVHGG